ncbi:MULTISPECIES: hypothetical protein [unclassified Moorena]|uniref:hypothetical protein n=1 Tax=unclassified Moorena TaxID=2683338 RepID=UPI0013BC27A9|nr:MULTISPECIES: hypothetical protein [unclassified Moorena]NEQ15564.1 hypothetical protein [Moorena sp. SIO3E2]NER91803.1 hypothetical protein [Moorena sp. SIO3A2]NES41282.1 hypothetical protein [Moorena sp. SIO2C4]
MSGSPKLVRYGADYPNPGHEAKNKGKSAPNTPYAPYVTSTLAYWPRDRVNLQPNNLGLLATRSRSTFNLLTFNLLTFNRLTSNRLTFNLQPSTFKPSTFKPSTC